MKYESYKRILLILIFYLVPVGTVLAVYGGQCAVYARNVAAGILASSYQPSMAPALCSRSGTLSNCGARWIYDDWDFGFGRGTIPKINSLIVLEATSNVDCISNFRGCGHVGIVTSISTNNLGETILSVDESNWLGDEQITYGSSYTFNSSNNTTRRNGGATNYSVRGFVYLVQNQEIPISTFDGAGSLIDPGNGGSCIAKGNYGCSRDVVRMHPHVGPSTGVFQVLRVGGQCDYVKLEGLVGAYVTVKLWNEGFPGSTPGTNGNPATTVYRSTFPAQIPLSQAHTWHVISVTSLSPVPVGETREVTMTCQTGSANPSSNTVIAPPIANRSANLNVVIPKFDNGYYWAGNGSLISFSNNSAYQNTIDGYGRRFDDAKKFISIPSKTIFQVYTDGAICKYVKIERRDGIQSGIVLSWKPWHVSDWNGMGLSLPYTLSLNTGYNIIAVDAINDGTDTSIRATCI